MATYLPNVTDFIPDIQPFQPDWSVIDKTMRLKQGRYDQNYSALQNTYSSLLNIPQLKQDQIDKRDKFLKKAFQNIGDLASVDLSLPENIASAKNVFAPLYNDTEFLGNASISKHYNQQEQFAESLRQKDGGKEFSMDNLNYVRLQKQEYINDNSPNAWEKYYSNKRYYEPYYDYSKELGDLQQKFKPSVTDIEYVDGAYIRKEKNASITANEYSNYLEANLSEKARRQLQIEASVRLGTNIPALTERYLSSAKSNISQINKAVEESEASLKLAHTQEEKDIIISQITDLNKAKETLQSNSDAILKGDNSYILNNKENLANKYYYNDFLSRTLKGAVRADITKGVQANQIWSTIYSNNQQDMRQSRGFAHDEKMKALDFQYEVEKMKLKGELGPDGTPGKDPFQGNSIILNTPEAQKYSPKDIENGIMQAQLGISSSGQMIQSHIAATIGGNVDPNTVKEFISKNSKIQTETVPVYSESNQLLGYKNRQTGQMVDPRTVADLQALKRYQEQVALYQTDINNLKHAKEQVEKEVKTKAAEDFNIINKELDKTFNGRMLTINLGTGKEISLSAKDVFDGINSGAIIKKEYKSANIRGGHTSPGHSIVINDKEIKKTPSTELLFDLYEKVKGITVSKSGRNISKLRNDLLTSSIATNRSMAIVNTESAFGKGLVNDLQGILGIPKEKIILRGVALKTGETGFTVEGDDLEKIKQAVTSGSSGRNDIRWDETNNMFLIKDMKKTDLLKTLSPTEKSVYDFLENGIMGVDMGGGLRMKETVPFSIDSRLPYNFQIRKFTRVSTNIQGNPVYDSEYHLYETGNPERSLFPGNSDKDPLVMIDRLRKMAADPKNVTKLIESLK